jgi:hypothetical protein
MLDTARRPMPWLASWQCRPGRRCLTAGCRLDAPPGRRRLGEQQPRRSAAGDTPPSSWRLGALLSSERFRVERRAARWRPSGTRGHWRVLQSVRLLAARVALQWLVSYRWSRAGSLVGQLHRYRGIDPVRIWNSTPSWLEDRAEPPSVGGVKGSAVVRCSGQPLWRDQSQRWSGNGRDRVPVRRYRRGCP